MSQQRQLAAILFTDIVGYTALMQENEQKAVALIKHYNSTLEKTVATHEGKILNYYGDGSLCIFPSATESVRCAMEIQKELQTEPVVPLRIGLHIGEIFFEDGKALGDGVNVASRIQSLGQAKTVLFSKEIFDKIKNHPEFKAVSLGQFDFKNVDESIEVFALANEGFVVPKREQMEGKLKEKKTAKRKLVLVAAVLSLVIVSGIIYYQFFSRKIFRGKEKSIAVLPFKNISGNKENEYFSDGITDDIITQLSKISDLKVISSTSTMQYKNTTKSLKAIADELDVAVVLEGGIQREGNNVHINAQLIDAATDKHIWADKYDRNLNDIFAIQSEVAQEIAYQLQAHLTKEEKNKIEKKPTDNLEAYDLFLKGRYAHDSYTQEGLQNAEAFYKQAIEKDPHFHEAYSFLAYLYFQLTTWAGNLTTATGRKKTMNVLERILSSHDTLVIDFITLGDLESEINKNYKKAEYYLQRAITLAPDDLYANVSYGYLLTYLGRHKEAEERFNKSRIINPIAVNTGPGENYYSWGKYQDAIKVYKETINLFPFNSVLYNHLSRVYLAMEQYSEAVKILNAGLSHSSDTPPSMLAYLAIAYFKLNQKAKASALIDDLKEQIKQREANGERVIYVYLAQYYSAINSKEDAFQYLELATNANDVELIWLKEEPLFKNLHGDLRYNAYLKRTGFD